MNKRKREQAVVLGRRDWWEPTIWADLRRGRRREELTYAHMLGEFEHAASVLVKTLPQFVRVVQRTALTIARTVESFKEQSSCQ